MTIGIEVMVVRKKYDKTGRPGIIVDEKWGLSRVKFDDGQLKWIDNRFLRTLPQEKNLTDDAAKTA